MSAADDSVPRCINCDRRLWHGEYACKLCVAPLSPSGARMAAELLEQRPKPITNTKPTNP